MRVILCALLVLVVSAPTALAAQTSWLDSPPGMWNSPGGVVPQAPPLSNPDARCRTSEVAPITPEQSALSARGWRLQSFWPPVSSGGIVVIGALAEYDGMCRPFAFNVFVFSGGQYAGTLSPVSMNSRFDGALFLAASGQVATIGASGTIAADFIRYADTDPLCCPSRGTAHVVYRLVGTPPVVLADSITARSGASVQLPARLPATGGAPDQAFGFGIGLTLVVLGLLVRRRQALRPSSG